MRLLNPSPGEVLDRITILDLKIQAAAKKGIDNSRFLAEKSALEEYLAKWREWLREDKASIEIWDAIGENTNGLMAVNALLWDAEDSVRATPDTEIADLAALCKRIAELNDSRAGLVHKLSNLYGATDEVGEKIYGAKRLFRTAQ